MLRRVLAVSLLVALGVAWMFRFYMQPRVGVIDRWTGAPRYEAFSTLETNASKNATRGAAGAAVVLVLLAVWPERKRTSSPTPPSTTPRQGGQ